MIRNTISTLLFHLAILSGILAAFGSILSFGDEISRGSVAEIGSACTSDESWKFGLWMRPTMRQSLKHPPHDQDEALNTLFQGYFLKLIGKRPEFQVLGDYLIYRSYYELHLYHFAQRGFYSILNRPVALSTLEITLGALGCLNQIYEKYPSMNIATGVSRFLSVIPVERLKDHQRKDFQQAIFKLAKSKLAQRVKEVDVSTELNLLRGSGPYEIFIRLLDASEKGLEPEIVDYSNKLLAIPNLPKAIHNQLDGIQINLARIYYQQGDYQKAIQMFKKVRQDSRVFTSSLSDRSWAFLMKKDYSGAAAASFNFRVSELRNSFAPDAFIILAISYYENCHYQAALDILKEFNKTYNLSYRALYDWYYQQKKGPVDYYGLAVKYMGGNTKLFPKNVALEWFRSGRFIAEQQEINLLFDEDEAARKVATVLAKRIGKAGRDQKRFFINLRNALILLIKNIPVMQKSLIKRINSEILWRNYSMIASLVESFENRQLLEVEILRTMGENVLNKKDVGKFEETAKKSISKKHDDDLVPVLNWGEISPEEPENVEVWKDELGAIETNVANICPKK